MASFAVHAGSLVSVVGESNYQEALQTVAEQATSADAFLADLTSFALEVAESEPDRRWFRAELVREPDNPHDPNAVAVHADGGGKVGYLSRGNALAYRPVFELLAKRGYEAVTCPALLNGGGDKPYGVVLALSRPDAVLNDLNARFGRCS